MTADHVCVFVEGRGLCSRCGQPWVERAKVQNTRQPTMNVQVHFTFSDGITWAVWLPESQHQAVIAAVLEANPITTYRVTR